MIYIEEDRLLDRMKGLLFKKGIKQDAYFMKTRYKYFLVIGLSVFISLCGMAQVNALYTQKNPLAFYSTDLEYIQYINALNYDADAQISITLQNEKNQKVCSVHIPSKRLNRGINTLSGTDVVGLEYSNIYDAEILRRGNALTKGIYKLCVHIQVLSAEKIESEDCFDIVFPEPLPLLLVEPRNQDKITNTRPTFSWTNVALTQGNTYSMLLVELKEKQSPVEALNMNVPIFKKSDIALPVLPFPAENQPLEVGKTYVWQVYASAGTQEELRSEVWTFSVVKPTEKKIDDQYILLSALDETHYYTLDEKIRIAYNNRNNAQKLLYEIVSENNQHQKVENLPEVAIQYGMNYLTINLSEVKGLKSNRKYLVKIQEPNNVITIRCKTPEKSLD